LGPASYFKQAGKSLGFGQGFVLTTVAVVVSIQASLPARPQ
jgi:hypothetical protein